MSSGKPGAGNFFSTDVYLSSLAETYFPGREWRIELFDTRGKVFRLLRIEPDAVITAWPFLDFVEPLGEVPAGPVAELGYLPHVALGSMRVEGRLSVPLEESEYHPAPYIDWSLFGDWAAFEAKVSERRGNLLPDSRRKRRRLEREVGPVRWVYDDARPETFERCVALKSAQYRANDLEDMFARPGNARMFRALREKGALVVSSLSAGDTLLAAHMAGWADDRFYSWVPVYDPAYARYSPGRLLFELLLRESFERGHREFDFLIGGEDYKWHYATHSRTIGPWGEPPLASRLEWAARRRVKRLLSPRLLRLARKLKRRLADWR